MNKTKICSKCRQTKPMTKEFFYAHRKQKDTLNPQCKTCCLEYDQSKKGKRNHLKYRQSRRGKRMKNERQQRFNQTEKGKEINKRIKAKRKRDLGWNRKYLNPFNTCEETVDHHINNIDVVAIPKELHLIYNGLSRKDHRESLEYIIKQIYGGKENE